MAQIEITSDFEGGNIKHLETVVDDNGNNSNSSMPMVVRLEVCPDLYTELEQIHHMQYFCFQAHVRFEANVHNNNNNNNNNNVVKVRYVLANAGSVSYPEAWPDTTVCYNNSYIVNDVVNDNDNVDDYQTVDAAWRRNLTTRYVNQELVWEHVHTTNHPTVTFAYFPPYTYQRHCAFMQQCRQQSSAATVTVLGQTCDGRDLHYITAGTGPLAAWIIHRQHPGETMAEHYAEGLLRRVLKLAPPPPSSSSSSGDDNPMTDEDAAMVDQVLREFTLHVVPCMCPDGAVRGHLRTNGVGANLNREWMTVHDHYEAPTMKNSPEVYLVWQKMLETGVDFFLDVHGDEELPYNFISGAEHVPTWGPRLQALHGALVAAYHRANKNFQAFIGYPPSSGPQETAKYLNVATNAVATRFDCLAATLEMPFKDCQSDPEPEIGWSPAKCRRLAESLVPVLLYLQPYLRNNNNNNNNNTWASLPPQDKYIEPTDDYNDFKPLSKRHFSDVRAVHGRVAKTT